MLHMRVSTWSPTAGRYVRLPNGTVLRSRERGETLGRVVDETVVRRGRAALAVEEFDAVQIEASLGGDALSATGRRVRVGRPGSWTPPDPWVTHFGHRRPRGLEGTAAMPFEVRFGREAFLRFVFWSEELGDFTAAPEGLVVTAWDASAGGAILGRAVTDRDGGVNLVLHEGERPPDLAFRVEATEGADATSRRIGTWSSRDETGVDGQGRGFWDAWKAQRLGTPDEPYVFVLGEVHPRTRAGNDVSLVIDGPSLLAAWESAIVSARDSIHFQLMLYFDDPMARRIQACILTKAREGVRVRMLIGMEVTRAVPAFVKQQIAWLKVFRSVPRKQRLAELTALKETLAEERRRAEIDALIAELEAEPAVTVIDGSSTRVEELPGIKRHLPSIYRALEGHLPRITTMRIDHRKLLVVDGRVAVLGGQNLGREYVYERPFDPAVEDQDEEWVKWHDVSVRLEGPVVMDLQRSFRERWVGEGGDPFGANPEDGASVPPTAPLPHGLPVRIVDTTPGARRSYHATMLALFDGARDHIHLMTPYFSNREALGALTAAARRGVAVTLVFPAGSDSPDYLYAARLWYAEMIEAGIAVYEYQRHMNHAKVAVVDDVAVVGTANMNHSSFFFHYELAAVVADASFARDMIRRLWAKDLPQCRRIQAAQVSGLLDITAAAEGYLRTLVQRRF